MKFQLFIFVKLLISQSLLSQHVVNSAGYRLNEYEVSIGEPIVHSASNSYLIITHGLLQPRMNDATNSIHNLIKSNELHFYPIPANNSINGIANFQQSGILNLVIYDLSGKLVKNKSLKVASISNFMIDLLDIPNGHYILRAVLKENNSNRLFANEYKITKLSTP